MSVTGQHLVDTAMTQAGKPYVFGAEAKTLDAKAWDCSELVEVVCRHHNVTPTVPDGAYWQWRHCRQHQTMCSVDQARTIPGAMLFGGDGVGTGRDAIWHVAFSRGDGTTIEARNTKYGTGTWPIGTRFQFAALIPGVDYTHQPSSVPAVASPPATAGTPPPTPLKDSDMPTWLISDTRQVWATNGFDLRPITEPDDTLDVIAAKLREWAFMGWSSNTVKADGVPEIPVNPDLITRLRNQPTTTNDPAITWPLTVTITPQGTP